MDLREFAALLFEQGRAAGFGDMEVYYQGESSTTVKVFKGDIDAYSIAEKAGVSFRGQFGRQMGYSFTERIDQSSIEFLLKEAQENAEVLENGEEEELFGGSDSYPELDRYSQELADTPAERLIEAAKELERLTLAADERIHLVNYCMVLNATTEVSILNTKGLDCHLKDSLAYAYVSALAQEEGGVTSGTEFDYVIDDFSKLALERVASQAAREAVAKLGAQTIESDRYPVILRNDKAAGLLKAFVGMFSGQAAERGLSLLQDRIGEQVAGANINIVDDPHLAGAPGSVPFDSDGTATSRHEVIKDGRLLTFLHNRKSAKKAGVESTGNAVKANYKSTVSINANNLYIQTGDVSLDDMIAGTERGLLITEMQGLHAGTNAVSGDFSLSALGHLIEHGKITRPVNQITISGNFLTLLNDVEAIGNDLRFDGLSRGACGSPSLKIKSLTISGK
jgi:PmbA protein